VTYPRVLPHFGATRFCSVGMGPITHFDGKRAYQDPGATGSVQTLDKLEVAPWSPERNACVAYVCGSTEKLSDLRENAFQRSE
jgi:hypothetical protein